MIGLQHLVEVRGLTLVAHSPILISLHLAIFNPELEVLLTVWRDIGITVFKTKSQWGYCIDSRSRMKPLDLAQLLWKYFWHV